MTHKFIRALAVAGLTLTASACGTATNPMPATEEVGPKLEARDVHEAVSQLASVQVLNVSAEGTPTFVKGHLGKTAATTAMGLTAASAAGTLQSALPGVAKMFRLDTADLTVNRVDRDAFGNSFVRYNQMKNGLPVVGGELVVHVNRDGEIFAANGSARDGSSLSATPRLNAQQALATAQVEAARSGSRVQDAPRLVYVRSALDQGLYLAYELRSAGGSRNGIPVNDLLYVDANGGSVVDRHPLVHTALSRKVYTANNGTTTPGTLKRSEGQAASGDSTLDTNYDKLGETYDCYKTNFGRDSYDNAGATYVSTVHYSTNYVNAYWDGSQMVYGDGDGTTSTTLAIDADVTTHELTHAVTARTSNLTYSGQSGGLNEAMSDIHAAFCQSYKSGTWSTSDDVFKIGELIWTPTTPGDALRYMYDPAKDGGSLDYAPDYTSSADVHYTSGIPNLAFTLLSRGGTHPRGKTTTVVTGIGTEKAGHIFYEANTNCLTSGATYADAKACTVTKATALYGDTVAASVTQAWEAVGVSSSTNPTPTGCTSTIALTNGTTVTGISATTGGQKCYSLAVPANSSNLTFDISGGTGDADLYVKFAAAPTTSTYDCRPYLSGNAENCTIASPNTGTYYVLINAYASFSGVSLKGAYATGSGGSSVLTNGVESASYSGGASTWRCFTLSVPAGKSKVTFTQTGKTGTTGDADLYVRAGAAPTTSTYGCRPYLTGNDESCVFTSPAAGTYYACSYGYSAYSAITLTGTY